MTRRALLTLVCLLSLASVAVGQSAIAITAPGASPALSVVVGLTHTFTLTNAVCLKVEWRLNGSKFATSATPPYPATYRPQAAPRTHTLKASCFGSDGAVLSLVQTTFDVVPKPVEPPPPPPPPAVWSFTAQPSTIDAGAQAMLAFTTSTTDVHNIFISGARPTYTCNATACSGSLVVRPAVTATYTLTSSTAAGTAHQSLSAVVTVTPAPAPPPPPPPPPSSDAGVLLKPENIVLLGAFELPAGGEWEQCSYLPNPNGGMAVTEQGTLLVACHVHSGRIGEFAIPEPRDPKTQTLLVAPVIQAPTELTEGRHKVIGNIGGGNEYVIGGTYRIGDACFVNAYHYYWNGDYVVEFRRSLFRVSCDFSVIGDVVGPFKVGNQLTDYTSGYIAAIPSNWQARLGADLLMGNCCTSIISRSSSGPAAAAVKSADLVNWTDTATPIPATPLLVYPVENPLTPWNMDNTILFNGTAKIRGAVFPEGTDTVLFYGRIGTGEFCYGGIASVFPENQDACVPGRENAPYAEPYRNQFWAYSALDLERAKAGVIKPWEIKPYAVWEHVLPVTEDQNKLLDYVGGGMAYDGKTNRMFIVQPRPNGNSAPVSVVYVYGIQP
jgi:hypothetical protein